MMPTIRDVAKVAGVSVSTVSRVINGHPAVKPRTREVVATTMQKLGFRPNQLARGLVGNKTYHIALAISSDMIQFYADTSRAIHDEALGRGYNLILFHLDADPARGLPDNSRGTTIRQLISTLPVDGFILVLTGTDDRLVLEMSHAGRPLVAVNRDLSSLGIDSVLADETAAVYEATRMLIARGHGRIGFIRGQEYNITCQMRFEGYRRAIEEAGLPQVVSAYDDLDVSSGYRSMQNLLERDSPPTGVIAINDLAAIGALKALHEAGRRVPADVSLIGFDNRDFSAYLEPPLTTIRKPKYEMGLEATRLLLDLIAGQGAAASEHRAARILLPAELIARASCAGPVAG